VGKPITYADITPLEPEWEVPGLVPKSFVTLIMGDGGVGKGQLWSDWAGRITTGRHMPNTPDDEPAPAPGNVLLVTSEDDPNMSTAWRLRAAGADLSRVYDMTDDFEIPGSLDMLSAKIDEIGNVRLVVIDPLADNLGTVPNSKRQISLTSGNVTLRKYVMRPLEKLARSKGIALVVIHHTVKSGRMAGSKGISDAARMVLRITRPDETQPLRLIMVEKTNIASGTDVVGYTITGQWPDVHVSYVDAPADDKRGPERELSTAEKILDLLADPSKYGLAPGAVETQAIATKLGIAYGTVRVAITRLSKAGAIESPKRGQWTLASVPELAVAS